MLHAVVRYHEIALKGRNRPFFVAKLTQNLRRATADLPDVHVQSSGSRIAVKAPDALGWPALEDRLKRVFGVANFSRVYAAPADLELAALKDAVGPLLEGRSYP